MKAIAVDQLHLFAVQALEKIGMCAQDARTVADALVTTDTFGVLSHGTKNLLGYIQKMQAGGLDAKAVPTVEKEGPAWALVNGNKAVGMVSASFAMQKAIEKAKVCGIAYVGVKNSCHFGAAGYYANMAAQEGMIGLAMSNTDPIMAVPGGCGVSIGSNPFSYAAPTGDGRSVFLDIALSNVAALKVIMAKEKGAQVPESWLVDEKGQPTSDSSTFPEHSCLSPMAMHKGYGLAVMVELLASVVTGAGLLGEVPSWNLKMEQPNGVGHAFIAIDIAQMLPADLFASRMKRLADELHGAPKADKVERIYLPGEMEWDKRDKALATNRLELTDVMAANMDKLSQMTGVAVPWLEA
ncbi:MAG: Ldh family oxidoreductase [Eubacteriales bacterium]|nr:Ldh family oxidoreductase [Eubacteriales bacterium]